MCDIPVSSTYKYIWFCEIHLKIKNEFQARDEEKNRRNNKDSTNQVMKDLEDLLPNKSLIPPPTEEEEPPVPGTVTQTCDNSVYLSSMWFHGIMVSTL